MSLADGWKLIGFKYSIRIFPENQQEFYKFRIINGKLIEL
jgi:hypothetical protein